MIPTWKNTFNTSYVLYGWFTTAYDAAKASAKASGYPFFSWNGWVYDTKTGHNTNVLLDTLDGLKPQTLKDDLANK